MTKAILGLIGAVLIAIVAARYAYSVKTEQESGESSEAWAQDRIRFLAWNNQKWTAWIRNNSFELVPDNTDDWSRHSNSSIAYIDWNSESWQAKVDGDAFLLARQGNWQGDVLRSEAIRYMDWSGVRQLRTIDQIQR